MTKTIKIIIAISGITLLLVAIATFGIAVYKGICNEEKQPPSVVVYINENDSIVNQLQMDVKRLSELLEKMESDSIIVSINKVKKNKDIEDKKK